MNVLGTQTSTAHARCSRANARVSGANKSEADDRIVGRISRDAERPVQGFSTSTGRLPRTRTAWTQFGRMGPLAREQPERAMSVEANNARIHPPTRSALVGTWQLLSCEIRTADGAVSYPWGPDAVAYWIYTQDGHVSYHASVADRPNFSSSDLFGGTVEEKVAAAGTFQSAIAAW